VSQKGWSEIDEPKQKQYFGKEEHLQPFGLNGHWIRAIDTDTVASGSNILAGIECGQTCTFRDHAG
jgi:hypothetical protein